MPIEEYHFGSITIDGKTYNYDVEVRWTPNQNKFGTGQACEVLSWWRKESHIIDIEDIKRAIDQSPEVIVVGTGESGIARLTDRAKEEIKSKGIELIIDITEQATKTFNIIKEESKEGEGKQRKIIGLFHLTC